MKKVITYVTVTTVILMSFLSACSSKGIKVVNSSINIKNGAQIKIGYSLPIVKEPLTIKFATADNPDAAHSYTEDLPVWKELEKRTGVKVEFEVVPSDQYNVTIQTRLAAGTGLPDIIRLPDDPMRYSTNGLIIPISDLIRKDAPNIQKLLTDRPEIKKSLTAPDGKIYFTAAVVDARSMVNLPGIGMRKDWLSKLNLKEPTTIDEWFTVLKAFKEGDPNGNNKKDEIPVISMDVKGLYKFAWSYGLHLVQSDGWYADKNNKVSYEWTDARLKQWLTEMNKWYKAGLLDPDMTSAQSNDKYTAKAIGNIGGVGASDMTMQYPQWNERMVKIAPTAKWEGIVPPAGPTGIQMIEKEQPMEGIYYGISKDCKNPDLVMQWIDYMFASEEGKILMGNFGIENTSYNLVNSKPQFNDSILKNPKGSGLAQNELGINGNFPRILMREAIEQRFYRYTDEIKQSTATVKLYVPSFPRILSSKEETDGYVSVMTDINTYRDEMITKFITGNEDLNNFDKYVKKIEGMGIQDAISIRQAQYDRYIKN